MEMWCLFYIYNYCLITLLVAFFLVKLLSEVCLELYDLKCSLVVIWLSQVLISGSAGMMLSKWKRDLHRSQNLKSDYINKINTRKPGTYIYF